VVLVARGADELNRAVAALRDLGREALAVSADVTDEADAERVVAVTHERFGAPEVLVNNAGGPPALGTLDELTWPRFLRGIEVDVRGTFNMTRAVAPSMTHGSIVNVAAASAGTIASPLHTAYSPSQAALHSFTRCTASWLAPAGVAVHCLCPSLTLAGGIGRTAAAVFGAAVGITSEEWVEQRLGTETLTPADVGDAVVALIAVRDGGTWSVIPAGLAAWDPFVPAVAR
jgi:3-oxoacyl-[acyl-carrier protein] reductase